MKHSIVIFIFAVFSFSVVAQNIAAFSGTKTPEVITIPNMSGEALTRGPGLTISNGSTFGSGNWATENKLDVNDYIEWSVTADKGYIVHINELQINFDRDPDGMSHFFTGNGPAKIRIRTSLDNFKSDIYAHDKVSNSGQSPIIETNLTSEPGGTIIFRLYGYSANIGMLGPLGTLDIEGGLGNVLGLDNTGIRLAGSLNYDGLLYSDGKWNPHPPNKKTGHKNALINNGSYTITEFAKLNNLIINNSAKVFISKSGSLVLEGDLSTSNNLFLESGDHQFSSLIVKGKVNGTANYSLDLGKVSFFDNQKNTEKHLFSAPFTGESYKDFVKANPSTIHSKNHSAIEFGTFNSNKGHFNTYSKKEDHLVKPADGYWTNSNKDLKFKGIINNKEIQKEIQPSSSPLPSWHLLGNPYPSYISLSDFLASNTSHFDDLAVGVYTPDFHAGNEWKIKNLAYLTLYPNAKISPGEGFMIASKAKGATINFSPKMQTILNTSDFNLESEKNLPDIGYLKLGLSNDNEIYTTEFYFNNASTLGMDLGYDALPFEDNASKIGVFSKLVSNSRNVGHLAVQSLPYHNLNNQIIVPLVVNTQLTQHSTFRIAENQLPKDINVYLEDRVKQQFTLLNTNNYSYWGDPKASDQDRFNLHFVRAALSFGIGDSHAPEIYTSNESKILHIHGELESSTKVSIFDTQERLLLEKELNDHLARHIIGLQTFEAGTYIVKLKNSSVDIFKTILIAN